MNLNIRNTVVARGYFAGAEQIPTFKCKTRVSYIGMKLRAHCQIVGCVRLRATRRPIRIKRQLKSI